MLNLFTPPSSNAYPMRAPHAPAAAAAPLRRYGGPERRTAGSMLWNWLAAALDEVDYGMLLLSDETHLMHANHMARAELDEEHPLQLQGRELHARQPADAAVLSAALGSASRRGLRKLLSLGEGAQRVSLSVVPLVTPLRDSHSAILVMLGKRQVCESLSVQGFARSHGLTPAELRVLAALCSGARPSEVAAELGVRVSTVRTQIGSIRLKTGAQSIHELVRQVCVLPPLMSVLRGHPGAAGYESMQA